MDIFKSQPARVGFIAAMAEKILGMPGMNIDEDKQIKTFENIKTGINNFINKIVEKDSKDDDILDLLLLEEKLNIRTNKVGDYERKFFYHAFLVFIEQTRNNNLETMTPCWSSYLG